MLDKLWKFLWLLTMLEIMETLSLSKDEHFSKKCSSSSTSYLQRLQILSIAWSPLYLPLSISRSWLLILNFVIWILRFLLPDEYHNLYFNFNLLKINLFKFDFILKTCDRSMSKYFANELIPHGTIAFIWYWVISICLLCFKKL